MSDFTIVTILLAVAVLMLGGSVWYVRRVADCERRGGAMMHLDGHWTSQCVKVQVLR